MEFFTHSPEETEALAQRLAQRLSPGDVIAYEGGLGCRELVTSPTYTIVNEYLGGRLPLFHFDMYRLKSSDDLWDIGWEDYLERGGVCAVEWSENVDDAMENAVCITIEGGDYLADLSL